MQIGLLGGTGPAGRALAARLAAVGFDVSIGSRSKERADAKVEELLGRWPDHELSIRGCDNQHAARADVVVVATPWDGAAETAHAVAGELRGKVVISMANALARIAGEFQPLVPPRGSVAATVQAAVPDAMVSAALHHVPAKELGDLDHPEAMAVTDEIVRKVPGLRPLDAGGLSNATPIEAFTAVLLQLNVRYKTRVAVQLTGIDDES